MHQLSYYHLILRYYGLTSYISNCHLYNRTEELFDFLMGVQMVDVPEGNTDV